MKTTPIFRGATDFGDTLDMQLKVQNLKEKKERMITCEHELDEQCDKIKQCLHNIIDDPGNSKYPLLLITFWWLFFLVFLN